MSKGRSERGLHGMRENLVDFIRRRDVESFVALIVLEIDVSVCFNKDLDEICILRLARKYQGSLSSCCPRVDISPKTEELGNEIYMTFLTKKHQPSFCRCCPPDEQDGAD